MNKMTCLIVDDEQDGRNALKRFLEKYCPDVRIVDSVASIDEAVASISLNNPELVFLDVNLRGESGFDLFSRIEAPAFHTVFVTAHEEWAIKAFKFHAIDYLLKPLNIDELLAAVQHVKQLRRTNIPETGIQNLLQSIAKPHHQEKIALPLLDGFVYVNMNEIIRCEAEGSYTYFYFVSRPRLLVCRALGTFEEQLKDMGFFRIHHQHLINLSHIEKYQRGRGGIVQMSDKAEVIVSQRKRDEFLKIIGMH